MYTSDCVLYKCNINLLYFFTFQFPILCNSVNIIYSISYNSLIFSNNYFLFFQCTYIRLLQCIIFFPILLLPNFY